MPFILGDKESLPENLQCYYDCIWQCPVVKSEKGSICYLTVHESIVEAGVCQRHDGLHIETPGVEHYWGNGLYYSPDKYEGGIYFASNIANTSIMYNALIDKNVAGIVDEHGGCEHLLRFIGP